VRSLFNSLTLTSIINAAEVLVLGVGLGGLGVVGEKGSRVHKHVELEGGE